MDSPVPTAKRSFPSEAPPTGTRARAAAPFAVGVVVALGVFVAMGRDAGPRTALTKPTVLLLGQRVAVGPDAVEKVRPLVRGYLDGLLAIDVGGGELPLRRSSLGARVDEERLQGIYGAPSAFRTPPGATPAPIPVAVDDALLLRAVVALKDDLDQPAHDARVDLEGRRVIAETPGRRLDAYATARAIDDALRRGDPRVRAVFERIAPTTTQAALANVEMTDTLGYFETKYPVDLKHVDRAFNLRLAASRLNGKVILPGETFDFNAVVGPRDEAHGYRVAKVIADGELVDGIGGGTCQIAGTLHGAALFAGLDIVQRTPHTRPSFYIKMGLDAAVAYPSITLKIRNPFSFPVVLEETVTGGVVRAEVLGPRRTRVVTFIRKIDDVVPFAEHEIRDERLPHGARVLAQRGIPGFKVRRYRVVRDGANAVREKLVDVYPPTTQIVRVGTGTGGRAPPDDEHPEYVADEYLAMTQGPGIGHRGGSELTAAATSGTDEVRTPGRTGTHGWSKHLVEPVASRRGARGRER